MMLRRCSSMIAIALFLASCAGSDGNAVSDSIAVTDDSLPAASTADLEAFCVQYGTLEGERPEAYVGSDEHLADIEALLAPAPEEVSEDVTIFRDYIASGAIDPVNDPETNLTSNFPDDVQSALTAVQSFATDNC